MTVTKEEIIKTRTNLVRQMHDYILKTEDEDIYAKWIYYMPDEPCEEDFEFFAEDAAEFKNLCEIFGELVWEETIGEY